MPAHERSQDKSADYLKDGLSEGCWLPVYNAAEVCQMQEDVAITRQLLR